jgi:hypothetical protein
MVIDDLAEEEVAELSYGALRRGWGTARMLKLEAKIHLAVVVHTGPELVLICAQLRADCEAVGHALAQRQHNADRWMSRLCPELPKSEPNSAHPRAAEVP